MPTRISIEVTTRALISSEKSCVGNVGRRSYGRWINLCIIRHWIRKAKARDRLSEKLVLAKETLLKSSILEPRERYWDAEVSSLAKIDIALR